MTFSIKNWVNSSLLGKLKNSIHIQKLLRRDKYFLTRFVWQNPSFYTELVNKFIEEFSREMLILILSSFNTAHVQRKPSVAVIFL